MTTRGLSVVRKPVDGASEPVTLEDLKLHVAIDSDDHDDLLNILLSAARKTVENYTGLSLIESNVTCRWEELTTEYIPYGPVIGAVVITGSDSVVRTDCSLEGIAGGLMSVMANSSTPVILTYRAGFEYGIEYDLQLAIMKLATDNFTHRTGISISTTNAAQPLPNDWKATAAPYSVKSWFL